MLFRSDPQAKFLGPDVVLGDDGADPDAAAGPNGNDDREEGVLRDVPEEAALPAPPLPAPPLPAGHIVGPSQLGYMYDTKLNRKAARLTDVWNSSVACKCYRHGCSVSIAEWKLPSLDDLRRWASVEPLPAGATEQQKKAAKASHVREMERLRDMATWPGRTRQMLVDEAAVLDAATTVPA